MLDTKLPALVVVAFLLGAGADVADPPRRALAARAAASRALESRGHRSITGRSKHRAPWTRSEHDPPAVSNPVYLALDVPQLDAGAGAGREAQGAHRRIQARARVLLRPRPPRRARARPRGLPIFLDLKLHDIPNTVAGAMQAIHVLEPAIVTVHASGGLAMMEDAKAAAALGTKVVAGDDAHQPRRERPVAHRRRRLRATR